jgi:hypothetical protein
LTHFTDSDFNDEKPTIGFDLSSGAHILNYSLTFSDDATGGTGLDLFETTDLNILGKDYYWLTAGNTSATNQQFDFLDSANTVVVTEGSNATSVVIAGKTYDISIVYIDTTDVILSVDGVQTNKLDEGDTYKVAEDTYVAVKSNLYSEKEAGVSKAEISIGSGKLTMKNGEDIELNTEDVDGVKAYITMSGNNLQKIVIEWNLDDDAWIAPGTDLTMPGLEAVKLSMTDFYVPNKEVTELENDGDDKMMLNTVVEDGDIDLNLLYLNSTKTGIDGIGKDSDEKLVTSENLNMVLNESTDRWFVASAKTTQDAESYVFELTDITDETPSKNTTTIKNIANDKEYTLDIGETETLGIVSLTLTAANDDKGIANFTISGTGATFNTLYTAAGMKIQLPYNSSATADGVLNVTTDPTSWDMNFTAEDKDGNINSGKSFTATVGITSDHEAQVSDVSTTEYETSDGSDEYQGYVTSDLATKTLRKDADQDTLEIDYAGDESYANVYVAAPQAVAISVGGTTGGLGDVLVPDTEAIPNNNLIVIGGSAVNRVSAQLLGLTYPAYGAAFTEKTGVGADEAILKLTTNPSYSTKVALLVAGWEGKDTKAATKALYSKSVALAGKSEVVLKTVTEASTALK